MSKLLVIRHGQARLFTDNYDRLSELGIRQARRLGKWFVKRAIVPDAMYSGSLMRQQQTASVVRDEMAAAGMQLPELQVLDGLNEYPAEAIMDTLVPELMKTDDDIRRLATDYDQATDYDVRYRFLHQLLAIIMHRWIRSDYDHTGAFPTWDEFSGGVRAALADTMQVNGGGKTVAVFTSGGPIGVSVQSALEAPDTKAADLNWRIYNGSVTRFTFSGDRLSLDAFNDRAHLPPTMLTFR